VPAVAQAAAAALVRTLAFFLDLGEFLDLAFFLDLGESMEVGVRFCAPFPGLKL
jgi:hypothetical protein